MQSNIKSNWEQNGFIVLPSVFDLVRTARLKNICRTVRDKWLACDPLTGMPGGDRAFETCMRHVIHPSYFLNKPGDLVELLETGACNDILAALSICFNEEPMFRSSSLFFNPTSLNEDGNWHRDTQFVYKAVADEQNVLEKFSNCGGEGIQVQIPLFESQDLEYISGSNKRWDTDEELFIRLGDNESRCRNPMPHSHKIIAAEGDAIFFDPNGIHRGQYHSSKTRLTLMFTFTKKSVAPKVDRFSYQPWFEEDKYLDGVSDGSKAFYQAFLQHYHEAWAMSKKNIGRYHSGRRS